MGLLRHSLAYSHCSAGNRVYLPSVSFICYKHSHFLPEPIWRRTISIFFRRILLAFAIKKELLNTITTSMLLSPPSLKKENPLQRCTSPDFICLLVLGFNSCYWKHRGIFTHRQGGLCSQVWSKKITWSYFMSYSLLFILLLFILLD